VFWERETKTHIYFLNGIFCQWKLTKIVDKDISYNCAEQYMMYQKAKLFGDIISCNKIMCEQLPIFQKALGREVSGYDDDTWNQNKFDIVVEGNLLKFTQNEELKKILLSTKDKMIVEASYVDPVWGIGLHYNDDKILDEDNWRGENLLGKAIMTVKNYLT